MGFQQAAIKIEREKEFEELKSAIVRALATEKVEKFLKRVYSAGCRVRNLEPILANGILEKADALAKSGTTAQKLYESLTVCDQAQMREFYLSKVEERRSCGRNIRKFTAITEEDESEIWRKRNLNALSRT